MVNIEIHRKRFWLEITRKQRYLNVESGFHFPHEVMINLFGPQAPYKWPLPRKPNKIIMSPPDLRLQSCWFLLLVLWNKIKLKVYVLHLMTITQGLLAQSPKPEAHDKMLENSPDRIGIWICWFLRRGENRSTRRKFS